MNWIDRAIAFVAPGSGMRRVAYRRAFEQHARAYDAARRDHRTNGWMTSGASANAEVSMSEELVRARSRDLVRNNGFALQMVETLADHIVGTGIVTAPIGLKGRNLKTAQQLWADWIVDCDFDGDQDLNGLLWLAVKGMLESGSSLIRFRRQQFDGATTAVPLKLQVLEPDFIDTTKNGTTEGGGWIDRGIEYDKQGRRVAFWLYDHHPGEISRFQGFSMVSERVPASQIAYLFDKLRPGQDRGMPILAPCIMPLQDLKGYFEAELVRKRVASCMVGVIEGTDENIHIGTKPNEKPTYGPQSQKFEPGMWTRLLPGEKANFNTPPADAGIDDMAVWELRLAAAGAGVMYEHTTGDWSRTTYTSYRAGNFVFRRRIERRQWNVAVHKACRPIAQAFTAAARAAALLPAVPGWRHTPPGFISVDPYKDAQADLANLRMGKVTLSQLVEERGYDYVEFLQEYADGLKQADEAMKDLGDKVMFDGDPRKVVNAGGAPKDNQGGAANETDKAAVAA